MKSLLKQRGFIHLTTGANGAGKTLFTLKEVRERSVKESRPVYHNGRFKLTADFGWKQIDFKDWQSCPDGSIFLIDECHNDMPVRKAGSDVPDHIRMLAEHRARGFDFYLITQHPGNIDVFVRRIVGSPGWHRHLKNFKGSPLVSKIEWSAVNLDCEKPSSGDSGTVEMVTRPTEVYKWYESATLHTVQRKLPKQLWIALACIPLFIGAAYVAVKTVGKTSLNKDAPPASIQPVDARPTGPMAGSPAGGSVALTPAQYVAAFTPRIPDLPHTAPVYDSVTQPTQAPYPAACVASASRCNCYSQQATRMHVSDQLCRDLVKTGFFVQWQQPQQHQQSIQPVRAEPEPKPATQAGPTISVIGDSWNTERIARSYGGGPASAAPAAAPAPEQPVNPGAVRAAQAGRAS